MKCPKCENELTASSNGSNRNYCKKCNKTYSEKECERIADAEMINEDHKIWSSIKIKRK